MNGKLRVKIANYFCHNLGERELCATSLEAIHPDNRWPCIVARIGGFIYIVPRSDIKVTTYGEGDLPLDWIMANIPNADEAIHQEIMSQQLYPERYCRYA